MYTFVLRDTYTYEYNNNVTCTTFHRLVTDKWTKRMKEERRRKRILCIRGGVAFRETIPTRRKMEKSGLVSKVSLNSCQRGCRHRFPVDKAASARCGCSNDHLIRERKNERENKRVSRLGSMLRKKKKKRGGDRKKKRSIFIHPTYPTHSSLDPLLSSTRNKEKISWIRSTRD